MRKHHLTIVCKDPSGHRVAFAAASRLRFLCDWMARRSRLKYCRHRGLPDNFLLVVKETWS